MPKTDPNTKQSPQRLQERIKSSHLISRDLSWLQFNHRVLDQARRADRSIFSALKFIAITASNLDEFMMIRVGSLYNYVDFTKPRIDYSGLELMDFKNELFEQLHYFVAEQEKLYIELSEKFKENKFQIANITDLTASEKQYVSWYFKRSIFPMLTPMLYDAFHAFPILNNKLKIFCVVTQDPNEADEEEGKRISFVQIPANLPAFYEIEREETGEILFVPIEQIIRQYIQNLYRNIHIHSVDLIRLTRNGDFTLEETEDVETDFVDEVKRALKTRKTGRVVRLETEGEIAPLVAEILFEKYSINETNQFKYSTLLDYTRLFQIVGHKQFNRKVEKVPSPVMPITLKAAKGDTMFEKLSKRDIMLHHPYNSADHLMQLLEEAAVDPNVLAIKLTIYRLAKKSRVIEALIKAAENGKHVSALFEVKARFDEENNIVQSERLQKAGAFVVHGIGMLKTHTKLLLIARKENDRVTRYVHMASGNYNEDTAKLYTDIGLMSSRSVYGKDVSEFFNAITGHSIPSSYESLLTAPNEMRTRLVEMIEQEAKNAEEGKRAGIIFKFNSLQDKDIIEALYAASSKGVPIKLIVRGICSLRPRRKGLSENIRVISIVGDFLEHTRLFYFENEGSPNIYGGSADAMVRSFDRRIESLFEIIDEDCSREAMTILSYNLKDNYNAYEMMEDGNYQKIKAGKEVKTFDMHKKLFKLSKKHINATALYEDFLAR